ncbi:MAG: hypothetical protein E5W76_11790 [Mesorhizobium sp.]|nr:MAG: hypothetical protein E5W76_11790 [Mesorhizobium sp.]
MPEAVRGNASSAQNVFGTLQAHALGAVANERGGIEDAWLHHQDRAGFIPLHRDLGTVWLLPAIIRYVK